MNADLRHADMTGAKMQGSELAGPISLDGRVAGVAIHDGKIWTTKVDGTKLFAVDPSSI